jgi:sulfhydrogenase subunit alpha
MARILELKPLTRVEGHGSVLVYLSGRRVEKVELSLCESPRLFEALLVGKSFLEVPEIICRICSICTTVHRLTSLAAIEQAFDIGVSPHTELCRELILHGGHIASHALHLFCLVLPDLYGVAGFADLATKAPDELRLGLRIKAAGNLIQETVGGRIIHPVTLIPGTMGHIPKRELLLTLKESLARLPAEEEKVRQMFAPAPSPSTALPQPCYLAVDGEKLPLVGTRLRLADGRAVPVDQYKTLLKEERPGHSNAMSSSADGTVVTVGALARLALGAPMTGGSARPRDFPPEQLLPGDIRANNPAQVIELFAAIDRSVQIVNLLLDGAVPAERPPAFTPRQGSGTAAMEAPRGTLIHNYRFDSRGICTSADIITPTAINQAAMERDLCLLARDLEGADEPEMCHQLEMLVRVYDPCISCAVHLVRL